MLKNTFKIFKREIKPEKIFSLQTASVTHKGKIRERNEDNYFVDGFFLEKEHGNDEAVRTLTSNLNELSAAAVFDGMGGESAGDLASYTAVKIFSELYAVLNKNRLPNEKTVEELLCSVSNAVFAAAKEHKYRLIGSTVSMLMFNGEEGLLVDLGDSPVYQYRERKLEKINYEHTNAVLLKEQGIQRKPALTQFLGIDTEEFIIEPYIQKIILQKGDVYLICSDGLTDMVEEKRIAEILGSDTDIKRKCEKLRDEALENGGVDNVTVILTQVM